MRREYQGPLNTIVADQAAMEGETAGTRVEADKVFYSPGVVKAYAFIVNSGTPFLVSNSSYNISSISGPGAGMVVINLTNQMSTTQYVVSPNAHGTSANKFWAQTGPLTTGSVTVFVTTNAALTTQWSHMSVPIWGDLP